MRSQYLKSCPWTAWEQKLQLLFGLCAGDKLVITNLFSRLPYHHVSTWKHPRFNHWHILGNILTWATDRSNVHIAHSMFRADERSADHRVLISRLQTKIPCRLKQAKSSIPQRLFDCTKLQSTTILKCQRIRGKELCRPLCITTGGRLLGKPSWCLAW